LLQYVDKTIAQKISEKYNNVTVIAPDGYVMYGQDENGDPKILGVENSTGDGGFVTIKNGKIVGKKQISYNSDTKKAKVKPYEKTVEVQEIKGSGDDTKTDDSNE